MMRKGSKDIKNDKNIKKIAGVLLSKEKLKLQPKDYKYENYLGSI